MSMTATITHHAALDARMLKIARGIKLPNTAIWLFGGKTKTRARTTSVK